MNGPTNMRVVHADGTSTPFAVKFTGREPRMIGDEPIIVSVYEATEVLAWNEGDHVEFDLADDLGYLAIRSVRAWGGRM